MPFPKTAKLLTKKKCFPHILPENSHVNTVKPVNKGHPRERQNKVFIDKWSLFGGNFFIIILLLLYFVLF